MESQEAKKEDAEDAEFEEVESGTRKEGGGQEGAKESDAPEDEEQGSEEGAGKESSAEALEDDDDVKELEALLAGTEDDPKVYDVLIAITAEALSDPEGFTADSVLATLRTFGMEDIIREARAFDTDMMADVAGGEVDDDVISEILGLDDDDDDDDLDLAL